MKKAWVYILECSDNRSIYGLHYKSSTKTDRSPGGKIQRLHIKPLAGKIIVE